MFRLLAVVVALLATSAPAQAIEVRYLLHESTDRGQHTVIIDAPWDAHGLRPVARWVDRRVDGLVIHERRGIDCRERVTCIRVHIRDYGIRVQCGGPGSPTSLTGCAQVAGRDPFMQINTHWTTRQSTMCHELLHTLGLLHHDGPGCLGDGARTPSRAELRALRGLF